MLNNILIFLLTFFRLPRKARFWLSVWIKEHEMRLEVKAPQDKLDKPNGIYHNKDVDDDDEGATPQG
ncbi:hypothetical protein Lal_00031618 [Lupinus albus]|nr:hypothetical protein Lal_00031618 [Lupinus albus]